MMKRITVLLLTISTVLCLASGASRAQQPGANSQRVPTEKNTLIVYLSRTNNTKAIAEIIHQKVGGTLVALELETPYPADYRATVQQVVRENETGYLPPLKTKIEHDRAVRFCVSWLSDLGDATAATRQELPAPIQLEGKDRYPIQHKWRLWRRQQF